MSRFAALLTISALALAAANAGRLHAAPPTETEKPGRYAMQSVDGGVLRMDTETGAMSLCTRRSGIIACEPVQDDRSAQKEADRLAIENRELRADIKRLEEQLGLGDGPQASAPPDNGRPDAGRPGANRPDDGRPGGRSPGMGLPSEKDVDMALTYMERMIKKFREKFKDMESSSGGKGTPL